MQGRGEAAGLAEVAEAMRRRDAQDSARAVAPLAPAADAMLLDTTTLDAEAVFAAAMQLIEARLRPDSP
jgi:cytidylate kinase